MDTSTEAAPSCQSSQEALTAGLPVVAPAAGGLLDTDTLLAEMTCSYPDGSYEVVVREGQVVSRRDVDEVSPGDSIHGG